LYTFTLPMFSLLQAAAGFVLLLACANLANLVFARMIGRQREIAVRTALGAGRGRLGQLFVSEALELSLIAGGVAIATSFWSVRALRTGIPVGWTKWVPGWGGIQVNANVLTFGILLALGVGLFFGLATVLHTGKVELSETLKDASRGTVSRAKGRLRSGLVVAQVMFAMVLLVCAGLMIQGFVNLAKIYQGFEPANVLRIEITLPEKEYSDKAKVTNFYQQLVKQTAALPGVHNATLITNPPASNVDSETTVFTIEGRPDLKPSDQPSADLQIASAGYFAALKIPLIAGRLLSNADSADSSAGLSSGRTLSMRNSRPASTPSEPAHSRANLATRVVGSSGSRERRSRKAIMPAATAVARMVPAARPLRSSHGRAPPYAPPERPSSTMLFPSPLAC